MNRYYRPPYLTIEVDQRRYAVVGQYAYRAGTAMVMLVPVLRINSAGQYNTLDVIDRRLEVTW
jgi:hypothetical protein